MQGRLRLPMFVVAAALLVLMATLATLQYRWLGRISEAERERRRATLHAHATAYAQDFDRELTRAYLTFTLDPGPHDANLAARVAARYDRWQSTARYPRMIRDVFVAQGDGAGDGELQRYNAAGTLLEPSGWPDALAPLRGQLATRSITEDRGNTFIHMAPSVWEDIPALVIATPFLWFSQGGVPTPARHDPVSLVLLLDRDYMTREMLPALAQQHFVGSDGADYQLAVVRGETSDVVYRSTEQFAPARGGKVDASMDLFQVRTQEFGAMASEIRRFSTFVAAVPQGKGGRAAASGVPSARAPQALGRVTIQDAPMSIIVQQQSMGASDRATVERSAALVTGTATALATRTAASPKWTLLVQHRAGSLEAAVDATRRRNLAISSGVLALLGVSVGFLVVSTRRAQELARQQMEFVAAVSHELRTPLAVIRSAGDNLADGVVDDHARIRRYGDLVRSEGRRLSEMVEQILEFAGIQSGQRGFALRPVAIQPLLEDIVDASATLLDDAGIAVEYDIPPAIPPVLADEAALRRALQNLVGNAIKYGAGGRWLGLRAAHAGREVRITVADRGIGIAQAEQPKIFDPFYRTPDVIAAQIQGAGLGLSLVKRIVEAHGGRIAVHSAPGAGSEFTIAMPAASEEPLPRAAVTGTRGATA